MSELTDTIMSVLVKRRATSLKQVRVVIGEMDEYITYLAVCDFLDELISRIEGRQSDLLDVYMLVRNFRDRVKEPVSARSKDVRKV